MFCEICNGTHVDAYDIELSDVPLINAGDINDVVLILRVIELRFCPVVREFYEYVTDEYNENVSIVVTLMP